jgi:hypothetical protein
MVVELDIIEPGGPFVIFVHHLSIELDIREPGWPLVDKNNKRPTWL